MTYKKFMSLFLIAGSIASTLCSCAATDSSAVVGYIDEHPITMEEFNYFLSQQKSSVCQSYSCFETFLKSLVNSRVRIMHIKRNCHGSYLNRPESILYSIKISFLYRIVLLNLLGISPSLYHENLISNIQRWNSWNDIMDNFLYHLQK